MEHSLALEINLAVKFYDISNIKEITASNNDRDIGFQKCIICPTHLFNSLTKI